MGGTRRVRGLVRAMTLSIMLAVLLPATLPASAASSPLFTWPMGHTIPTAFRPLWEQLGSQNGLGWPLDEAQPTSVGVEQWFEYGRVVQKPNGLPELALVGREAAQSRSLTAKDAFKTISAPTDTKTVTSEYVAKWGHTTANGFYAVWNAKRALLGAPISEEFTEDGATVQYFEYGRLELDAAANNIARLTMLGILAHGPAAAPLDPPNGMDVLGDPPIRTIQGVKAHTGHWLLVNLATQHLYAYDGNDLVQDLAVSTGTAANPTPPGSYTIQQRFRSQEMIGPGYDLPNVEWVQYFGNENLSWHEGYSFHGTYWHHNWGHPMSHGCVNLPNDFASWLWDWAGVGTPAEIIAG